MKNKKGFTLTEVLLAVMIVGIIGVALASLTTAASRESSIGGSRVTLRNSATKAIRQLRQDVHNASKVVYVRGAMASAHNTASGTIPAEIPLLVLAYNLDLREGTIEYTNSVVAGPKYVAYCFLRGDTYKLSSGDSVQPTDLTLSGNKRTTDEGVITRVVWDRVSKPETVADLCPTNNVGRSVWLRHVKFISNDYKYNTNTHYPVPLFVLRQFQNASHDSGEISGFIDKVTTVDDRGKGAILDVKLILELPTSPVVNEAIEEQILLSNGGIPAAS